MMSAALRVATWNLYLGADLTPLFDVADEDALATVAAGVLEQVAATRFGDRAEAVAAVIARERPDLVGLQEVSRWWTATVRDDGGRGTERTLVDFLPTLLDALADQGAAYDAHAETVSFSGALPLGPDSWQGVVGRNVVLVRRDAEVRVTGERAGLFDRAYELVTGTAGSRLPVARSWGGVDVDVAGQGVRFLNTHLEAWDAQVRRAQLDELLAGPAAVDGPVVMVGDLNAEPAELSLPEDVLDAWQTTAVGEGGRTWGLNDDLRSDPWTLSQRIDYVLAWGVSVTDCRVVGDRPQDRTTSEPLLWPSDHAGVVADLRLS